MNDQNSSSLQNWNAFWDYHLGAWDGQWTRYKPSGELSESFLSNRSFESDPEKKIINQFNQYFYRHGEHEEKRWTYSFKDHCKNNGFMHPASVCGGSTDAITIDSPGFQLSVGQRFIVSSRVVVG